MINKQYADFFKNLENNNNREWFHEHKNEYDDAKEQFVNLLNELIPNVELIEPDISPDPKAALFRINRDIRFSKDKTPYNTLMKAGFSPGGKRSFLPGFYLGISAESIHVGGGLFNLKGPELKKVRSLIALDPKRFNKIVESKSFLKTLGALKGDKAKRLDVNFQEALTITPYIANKQFYAMAEIPLKDHFNSAKLPAVIMSYFKEISTLNKFLKEAF